MQRSLTMSRLRFLLTIAAVLLSRSAYAGDNWPQFRGPKGQGVSAAVDLPVVWSDTENVVWKVPIEGEGWSSPVLFDGRVYLSAAVHDDTDSDAGGYSLRVVCLDAKTGEVVWQRDVFRQEGETDAGIHNKNSHASATPLVSEDRLYVHFGHQGTACLDLDGDVIWRSNQLPYEPVHGNGGSPVLAGDALVFSCDGAEAPFVAALDRTSGDVLWKTPRPGDAAKKFSFSTPLAITVDGRQQVVSPGSDAVCAYDPETGREIWRVTYDGYSVIPRPVFGHGLVYVCTGFGSPSLLAIRPDGSGDVTETHVVWSLNRGVPHTPSLLLLGDEIYMVSDKGIASCVDAHSGEVHWTERLDGAFSASPVYADGKIYFQAEEGEGFVIKADKQFELIARNELKARTLASYAIGERALFIRTDGHLYRIERL